MPQIPKPEPSLDAMGRTTSILRRDAPALASDPHTLCFPPASGGDGVSAWVFSKLTNEMLPDTLLTCT